MSSHVRVLIAATNGDQVEIENLKELRIKMSVVCVGGGTTKAGISDAYNRFVTAGTGIIQQYFGVKSWRLELSSAIDAGESWQLSAFIAHALENAGRLAKKGEAADIILAATGEVHHDLSVASIKGLAAKVNGLINYLTTHSKPARLIIAWPKSNHEDVDDATRRNLSDIGAEIIELEEVWPLLKVLSLAGEKDTSTLSPQRPRVAIGPKANEDDIETEPLNKIHDTKVEFTEKDRLNEPSPKLQGKTEKQPAHHPGRALWAPIVLICSVSMFYFFYHEKLHYIINLSSCVVRVLVSARDQIPISQDLQDNLKEIVLRLSNGLEGDGRNIKNVLANLVTPYNNSEITPWVVAQVTLSNLGFSKTLNAKYVTDYFRGTKENSCACWREIPLGPGEASQYFHLGMDICRAG